MDIGWKKDWECKALKTSSLAERETTAHAG